MNLEDADRTLRELVAAIPVKDRVFMLDVLTAESGARSMAIGGLHAGARAPATTELLIDAEADPVVRAMLVGLLREATKL